MESPGAGVPHALSGAFALAMASLMLTDDPAHPIAGYSLLAWGFVMVYSGLTDSIGLLRLRKVLTKAAGQAHELHKWDA